jgi:hypothetical protein
LLSGFTALLVQPYPPLLRFLDHTHTDTR